MYPTSRLVKLVVVPALPRCTNSRNIFCRDVLAGENLKGFNFNGDGYVIIDKARFKPKNGAQITIKFKSTAEDGLLFLMGDPVKKDFLAIQLKGGKIALMVKD